MSDNQLTVYYDGSCPLCRREIALYRELDGSGSIIWCDVSNGVPSDCTGLTQSEALDRFHVREADGTLLSGAAAFMALWERLPGFRLLPVVMARIPGGVDVLEAAYGTFHKLRPVITGRRPPEKAADSAANLSPSASAQANGAGE